MFLKTLLRTRETQTDKAIVERVEKIAKAKGVPMAAVAIAWTLSKQGVNPIIGLGSKQRIDEAVAAIHVKLTGGEMKELEELYAPKEINDARQ